MEKKCFKCGETKPLSEYYKHQIMKDGHLNKCKECTKKDTRERAERKSNDPEWVLSERKRHREKSRKYRDEGRVKKYNRKSNIDPKKKLATQTVGNAIRDKRIVKKPCAVCGKSNVHAHHEDYSKPLDVVFLCIRHHNDRHIHIRDMAVLGKQHKKIGDWIESMKKESILI